MRARKIGRRVGGLVAVAAFGVGAVVSTASTAAATESETPGSEVADEAAAGSDESPEDFSWE